MIRVLQSCLTVRPALTVLPAESANQDSHCSRTARARPANLKTAFDAILTTKLSMKSATIALADLVSTPLPNNVKAAKNFSMDVPFAV